MMKPSSLLAIFGAAAIVAACGDVTPEGVDLDRAGQLVDISKLAEKLPPEAKTVVVAYKRDLRGAVSAHVAEFGQFPADLTNIASVAGARTAAVNLIADGLGEQLPFASRETAETTANAIITAAERRILDRMRTENAPNP